LEEDCKTKQDFAASGTELVTPSAASTCSRVGPFPRKEYSSSKTWGVGVGGGGKLSDKRPWQDSDFSLAQNCFHPNTKRANNVISRHHV